MPDLFDPAVEAPPIDGAASDPVLDGGDWHKLLTQKQIEAVRALGDGPLYMRGNVLRQKGGFRCSMQTYRTLNDFGLAVIGKVDGIGCVLATERGRELARRFTLAKRLV